MSIIDLIDGAIRDGGDAMRWSPRERPPDYFGLSDAERAVLHAWFDAHGIDHRCVPIRPDIRVDEAGLMSVEVYSVNERGKHYVAGGRPAMEWVTFMPTSPMPWRGHTTMSGPTALSRS